MPNERVSVILLAGGKGTRIKSACPKQFLPLAGKEMICHSLDVFLSIPSICEIVIVCDPLYRPIFSSYPVHFAKPGERRQDSVYNGFQKTTSPWICVHDAARPFITKEMVERLISAGKVHGAAALGTPFKSTVKLANENCFVDMTPPRDQVWEIQTPQFLHRDVLENGFAFAIENSLTVTDDVSLAELIDHPVKIVEGSYRNIKITTPEDLLIAEHFITTL